MFGVLLKKAPQSWQIVQQKEGFASIFLAGEFISPDPNANVSVVARVMLESDNSPVIHWQTAQRKEKNTFEITLEKVPAGGLYRIETALWPENGAIEWSWRGDMVFHVGVGDVFAITGQSNAAGYGKDSISDAPELGVHLYKNNGKWDIATHPFNDSTDTIHEVNMEGGNSGTCPYLAFAKVLKQRLGYPIGLLQTSLGGSPLAEWNPKESGRLYHNMISVIGMQNDPNQIKGILWYQGCSDTSVPACDTYLERFQTMVESMRAELSLPELPIYTIQLNRHTDDTVGDNHVEWAKIREAERQAARQIPFVYVIPATDGTLSDGIHNNSVSNVLLGERLAKLALQQTYGKPIPALAPNLTDAKKEGENTVLLTFENVFGRLDTKNVPPDYMGMMARDENGDLAITGYSLSTTHSIQLVFARTIQGKLQIFGASSRNPAGITPVDMQTYLPMLSFYIVL